ncbi:MAG TPA: cytochrome c oxidase assembly protein, partial [Stellaceae bacterium]|nr:cytochrome c oxidase assembly protein [Stellaceae bacterium]
STIEPILRYAHLVGPDNPWAEWPISADITLPLLAVAILYIAGAWDAKAPRRSAALRHCAFFGGLATVFLALQSPIEPVSDHVVVVHEIEHMLLGIYAPGLIMIAAPQAALLRGLPDWARRRVVAPLFAGRLLRALGIFRHPLVATGLFVGTTYFWMVPRFYDIALLDEPVHYLWHMTLLLSGLLFFWCLLDPRPYPYGASLGARLFMLWLGSMGHILLGAFLSFKTVALYRAYDELGRWWAIGPLRDEQLGGLTMWVVGCMMISFAGLLMIHHWLKQEEKSVLRAPVSIVSGAELRSRRRAANRTLALGLLAFAVSGLLIALAAAVAYHYSAALMAS